MKVKPKIWSTFDEPYSSSHAKVSFSYTSTSTFKLYNSVVSRHERYCCTTFLYKRITKDFITTRKYFNMIHMKLHHLHIPTLH